MTFYHSFIELLLMHLAGIGFFGLDMSKLIPYQVKPESELVRLGKNSIMRLKQIITYGGFTYFFYHSVMQVGDVSVDKILKTTSNIYYFNVTENG